MTRTYPLPPDVASRAAADYLTMVRAGMIGELRHAIEQTIEAHRGPAPTCMDPLSAHHTYTASRLDKWRDGDGYTLRQAEGHAADLAELLDCRQADVAPHIVPPLLGEQTRRTITLMVLRDMAAKVRRVQAQAHHYTARRRTA